VLKTSYWSISLPIERVPSGISGLDSLIGGGFPKGSLILLAGHPGSGKTSMAGQFLYAGATSHQEKGIYVSFSEGREVLLDFMSSLGIDMAAQEKLGNVKVMDMVTVKEEGLSTVLQEVLDAIYSLKARRLALDSFSAMAQAFTREIDARIMLHTILTKIVRAMGCTTVMTCEVPWGSQRIGMGIEEFIADGIMLVSSFVENFSIKRRLLIVKMRGTGHSTEYHDLILSSSGVKVVPVPSMK